MENANKIISYFVNTFKYYSDKRFTTISGTLVYFFLMSLAPFLFWLSLFFGKVEVSAITNMPVLSAAAPLVEDLQVNALSATSGAGIIFIVTTLYSSTNFFFHLRRSGEIIYGSSFKKGGIKLRLYSLGIIVAALFLTFLAVSMLVFGGRLIYNILGKVWAELIIYSFALAVAIFAAILLNLFICPYKIRFSQVLPGSLLSVLLWVICGAGFAIYLKFANPAKLYGKIASLIVFLLWCYLMMNSFIIGVIYNGRYAVPPTDKYVKDKNIGLYEK
ncbi:MAG: YihY/virulence factor BrkB family protein [Clostridia bacterium]|nr:YihY/virulence factor BrkB family protein [Clostridia bacterium]